MDKILKEPVVINKLEEISFCVNFKCICMHLNEKKMLGTFYGMPVIIILKIGLLTVLAYK